MFGKPGKKVRRVHSNSEPENPGHSTVPRSQKDVERFLKSILMTFVEVVDVHQDLEDHLIACGVINSQDTNYLHGLQYEERARFLWSIFNDIDHTVFLEKVLPILCEKYPHILPPEFRRTSSAGQNDSKVATTNITPTETAVTHDVCTHCAIKRRVRPTTLADLLYSFDAISYETHKTLTKDHQLKETDWKTILRSFKKLSSAAAPNTEAQLKTILSGHSLSVPSDLGDLMSKGFPCKCESHFPRKRTMNRIEKSDAWKYYNSKRLSQSSLRSVTTTVSEYPKSDYDDHDEDSDDSEMAFLDGGDKQSTLNHCTASASEHFLKSSSYLKGPRPENEIQSKKGKSGTVPLDISEVDKMSNVSIEIQDKFICFNDLSKSLNNSEPSNSISCDDILSAKTEPEETCNNNVVSNAEVVSTLAMNDLAVSTNTLNLRASQSFEGEDSNFHKETPSSQAAHDTNCAASESKLCSSASSDRAASISETTTQPEISLQHEGVHYVDELLKSLITFVQSKITSGVVLIKLMTRLKGVTFEMRKKYMKLIDRSLLLESMIKTNFMNLETMRQNQAKSSILAPLQIQLDELCTCVCKAYSYLLVLHRAFVYCSMNIGTLPHMRPHLQLVRQRLLDLLKSHTDDVRQTLLTLTLSRSQFESETFPRPFLEIVNKLDTLLVLLIPPQNPGS